MSGSFLESLRSLSLPWGACGAFIVLSSRSRVIPDRQGFQLGSLSHMINSKAHGYQELPDFPEVAPDASVRNVEVRMYMTSLPLVNVCHHGHVTRWKSRYNFISSASSVFLVHWCGLPQMHWTDLTSITWTRAMVTAFNPWAHAKKVHFRGVASASRINKSNWRIWPSQLTYVKYKTKYPLNKSPAGVILSPVFISPSRSRPRGRRVLPRKAKPRKRLSTQIRNQNPTQVRAPFASVSVRLYWYCQCPDELCRSTSFHNRYRHLETSTVSLWGTRVGVVLVASHHSLFEIHVMWSPVNKVCWGGRPGISPNAYQSADIQGPNRAEVRLNPEVTLTKAEAKPTPEVNLRVRRTACTKTPSRQALAASITGVLWDLNHFPTY